VADTPTSRRGRDRVRLTDRDHELLAFAAEHRLVLTSHVQTLLGTSATAASTRLRALARGGFVSYRRVFHGQPAFCQIRRKGLAVIASDLPAPRLDLACYKHDVGAAWLWLAARNGTFGPLREVLSERQLRSGDGAVDRQAEPHGVRLGGVGPHGRPRLHYPDLLLITPEGRRIAIELELSSKGRTRREKILAGYASDSRIDAVLYLPEDRSIARAIQNSARRLGIAPLVHVQPVRYTAAAPGEPPSATADRARRAGRSRGTELAR
jgi:hypothetical protein